MPDQPILVFPQATVSARSTRGFTPPTLVSPSKDQQVQNFNNRMGDLDRVFINETARFAQNIEGLIPEMVLVFEVAGTIDEFFKAVESTPGMEYLMEFQDEFLDDGMGFFYRDANNQIVDREIEKRIFVSLTNQRGILELLSYWRKYRYGEVFPRGATKFRNLFGQLNNIRPYNVQDRLRDTGFEKYLDELRILEVGFVKFEIEFVFHTSSVQRNAIITEINTELANVGGAIINESISVIPEIKYFGAIAEAAIDAFENLTQNAVVTFLKSQRILFFKPVGQSIGTEIDRDGQDLTDDNPLEFEESNEEPIVALLDGMPLENHQKLNGKIALDDPDDFSNNYLPSNRIHGTSMASLIIHGDLDNPSTIKSRLYVRPILQLIGNGNGNFLEKFPENKLIVDLIHRAVIRMFDGPTPIASSIKIINFSIGDEYRPFLQTISTWAKLLDYLAYRYKVLFIISAGNYNEKIVLPVSSTQLESLTQEQREVLFYKAIFEKNYERKILTPSESVNGLTIGGFHNDGSIYQNRPGNFNPCMMNDLPCLYSRIGYGFNKSLKPDLIFDSGRSLYRISGTNHGQIELRAINGSANYPPGIKTAIPGLAGTLNSIGFSSGTSNANALISNKACKLYEVLEDINQLQSQNGGNIVPKNFYAVLLKTLIVHYSDCENIEQKLTSIIHSVPGVTDKIIKEYIYQNAGYGVLNKKAVGICTEKRVTVIGFGKLKKDEGHIYKFPLPNVLSGKKVQKNLKISLGWISPINFSSGKYKMAQLYFDNIKSSQNDLYLDRAGADINISRRGTIQHDILSNESADVYINNSELAIKINCKELASGLKTRYNKYEIEYGLAVTLEIDKESEINIYDEVRTKLSQRVRVSS